VWDPKAHRFDLRSCDDNHPTLRVEGGITGSHLRWRNRGNDDEVRIQQIDFQKGTSAICSTVGGNAITALTVFVAEGQPAPSINCTGREWKLVVN
jgi:hypothetical protein